MGLNAYLTQTDLHRRLTPNLNPNQPDDSRNAAPTHCAITESVIPELREQKGYVASNLLKRVVDAEVEITVISFWHSLEAIDAFAGADREAAVVAPKITA